MNGDSNNARDGNNLSAPNDKEADNLPGTSGQCAGNSTNGNENDVGFSANTNGLGPVNGNMAPNHGAGTSASDSGSNTNGLPANPNVNANANPNGNPNGNANGNPNGNDNGDDARDIDDPPTPPPRHRYLRRKEMLAPIPSIDRHWLYKRAIEALNDKSCDGSANDESSSMESNTQSEPAVDSPPEKAGDTSPEPVINNSPEPTNLAGTSKLARMNSKSEPNINAVVENKETDKASIAAAKKAEADDEIRELVEKLNRLASRYNGHREEMKQKKAQEALQAVKKKRRSLTRQYASDAGDADDDLDFASSSPKKVKSPEKADEENEKKEEKEKNEEKEKEKRENPE